MKHFVHHLTPGTLDEWVRAIGNGVNVVRSCAQKSGKFCAGGAATEIVLGRLLQRFAATVPGLDQYAVAKFAEALEMVPKILADNAGYARTELLTKLYQANDLDACEGKSKITNFGCNIIGILQFLSYVKNCNNLCQHPTMGLTIEASILQNIKHTTFKSKINISSKY
jgi:chaperonin GroEL (HSP60 family)